MDALVWAFGFKAQSNSFTFAFSCLCLSGPCRSDFIYDHSVTFVTHCTGSMRKVFHEYGSSGIRTCVVGFLEYGSILSLMTIRSPSKVWWTSVNVHSTRLHINVSCIVNSFYTFAFIQIISPNLVKRLKMICRPRNTEKFVKVSCQVIAPVA